MKSSCVTILIPTYARTAWLQEALWCAINQTIPAQIIVLNDCPGQTLVCDHPLVTIVNLSERIATLGKKRNALLSLAETEWVTWLDDDDWLLPWYIKDLTKTFSESLDAVLTTRCWRAYGGSSDGVVKWNHGSAFISSAVRLQIAKTFGGFPNGLDRGEDRVFRTALISRGRTCSLSAVSGYCYRWDNEVYHTSGLANDPLAGVGFGKNAEFRFNHSLEPFGRIVLSPSLRHDYFKNCPDIRGARQHFVLSSTPEEPSSRRVIAFGNLTLKVIYPPRVEIIIARIFLDFEEGQEGSEPMSLVVNYDPIRGRYNLSYAGQKEKTGILFHDLGQQLLTCINTALLTEASTDLAVYAGAVSMGKRAILLPGIAGTGKSFLTAWFLGVSYAYLTDNLVWVGQNHTLQSLYQPLSFKKSAGKDLKQLIAPDKRGDIIEGTATDLVPWRLFSGLDNGEREVSAALLIFPEFRSGADLSLEALTPAQAALLLMGSVANGRNLPGHGFPHVSRICKQIPALRLIYGESKQLPGVLERIVGIVLDYNLAPADLVAFAAPFNRNRHIEQILALSRIKASITPQSKEGLQEKPVGFFSVPLATPKGPQKKLTIGMATYDDYDGVYFSIQAIRLYHSEILDYIEILVIDNHPDGPCAEALKKLDTTVAGYRYVPEQGMTGTAVRDLIFREACGEFVLSIDCHVMIVPGALKKLIEYLDAHPENMDLLQGPLVSDDLMKISTHFQPTWRKGMFGVWETDECNQDSNSDPFEIPMQGLGLFCCRREFWPGFNPRFRGFGGEEGYIHEKFRKNGGRILCLPFLRWLHRFERPMGIPYKNRWEDRIHNYMVGFQEVGLELQPVEDHFAEQLGKEAAGRICDSIRQEMQSPFSFFDAIYCITLDTASDRWKKMLPRLRALGIEERVRAFQAIATPENHHIGCALSHRGIIADAQRRQLNNVLVFEDDAIFLDDTLLHLAGSVEELKSQDWHIFYLGGHKWGQSFPFAEGCSFLQCPKGLTCTHALAYNSSSYNNLLDELPQSIVDMAQWIKLNKDIGQCLRKLDKLYLAAPAIASQIELLPHEDQQYRSRFNKTPPPSYKYEFSICAIFKNEGKILKEWIDHHLLFGCQHFYLINNASDDGGESILLPYIERGLIDLVNEPRKYRQFFAYNEHFLEIICRDTRWIGIIDIDEYLYPRNGSFDIKEILRNCDGVDALAVPWLLFGSSGFIKQPENVVNSFIFRKDYDRAGWTSFKTVVRTDALGQPFVPKQESWDQCVLGVHSHRLKPGKVFLPTFLPSDIELKGGSLPYCYDFQESRLATARLVINHYRIMSLEYYQQNRMKKPSVSTPYSDIVEGSMEYFNGNDTNEIKDEVLKNLTRKHPANVNKQPL